MNGKRRHENNEYANIVKAELRKSEDPVMPDNFEPGHSLKDMLRRGLQELTGESPSCGSTIREEGGGGGEIAYFKP